MRLDPLRLVPFRSLLLPPALVLGAAPAAAQLHVGGADSLLYEGDPTAGGFESGSSLGGAVTALTQAGNLLYAADATGAIYAYSLGTGVVSAVVQVDIDPTDMVFYDGTLVVSGSDGTIVRLNAADGQEIESFAAGFEVAALAIEGDVLYAGTPFGLFHEKDLAVDGGFTFAGLCGGPINSIVSTGPVLYLGDTSGNVYVYDKASEFVTYAYTITNDATAVAADGDHFLFGGSDGTVLRVVAQTGAVADTFNVGTGVEALALETAQSALIADRTSLSLSAGGDAALSVGVHADVGADTYWVLGSLTGKSPAFSFGDVVMPLVPDAYLATTLRTPFGPPIADSFGALDPLGGALATLQMPAGTAPSLVGTTLYHASLVASLDAPELIVDCTNAVALELEP